MLKSGIVVRYKRDKTIFGVIYFKNDKVFVRYLIDLNWLIHDIAEYEDIFEAEEFWKEI